MVETEGYIEVTGGKVWYKKVEGENAHKTPLLILHGGPGSSHYSMQGLAALAEERSVIFYDQLGCGYSDMPNDHNLWNLDRFVNELVTVRQALSLDNVHILGHSWGTTLAAAYLLTKPERVESVIFSSPCLSAPMWAKDQDNNRKKLPHEVQKILKRNEDNGTTDCEEYKQASQVFAKQFICRLDPKPEILVEAAKRKGIDSYQTMWGPSEFHVTGNLRDFDCTDRLKEITQPSLYTCGRFDEATPETTEYYHSLTPHSTFHIFEQSAHLPYLEEKQEYLQVIQGFLQDIN